MKLTIITFLVLVVSMNAKCQNFDFDSLNQYINSKTDTVKIKALYLSAYNLSNDFPDSALILGKKALKLSDSLNYLSGIAESNNNIGAAMITLSLYDSAVYYYSTAILYYHNLENKKGEATALNNLGHIEQTRGDYEKATEYLMSSMKLNEEIGNKKLLGSNYINLGIVLSNLHQVEKAISYYKKAIPIKEEFEDYKSLGNIYNNIGIELRAEKKYDSALMYYKKAIEYRKKVNSKRALAMSYSNLGILYFYLDKKDSTLILFNQVLNTYLEIGNTKEVSRAYYNISELHNMNNEPLKSIINLEKSLSYAKLSNSKEQIRDALKGLAQVNAALHHYNEAYQFRVEYEVYKDSLLNEKNNRNITELNTKYETEKKDNKIQLLNSESRLKDFRLTQSKKERNYLIGGIIIVLLFSSFIFYNYRAKQKANIALEKALNDRNILLKEIHHRVKNNLQIVSSLLNLQSKSIDDGSAKEAVLEGRNRVKSMAMIHQKLYQKDNLTGVSILDYINNLAESLFSSYGINNDRIILKTDIEDLNLDIDTTIPLGLILNELITNSLKYAFPNNQNGELLVSLKKSQDKLVLLIQDNGIGIKQSQDSTNPLSFGLKLVHSLSRKLKASVDMDNSNGTSVSLRITNFKMA